MKEKDYETRTARKIAKIMDPRFEKDGFRNKENTSSAVTLLEQQMHAICQKNAPQKLNLECGKETSVPERRGTLQHFLYFWENE